MVENNSDAKAKPKNDAKNEANGNTNGNNLKYSYTSAQFNNALEDENKILKEAMSSLRDEVERLRAPSLMVAEITDMMPNNKALIKIPNGNKFFVTISSNVKKS